MKPSRHSIFSPCGVRITNAVHEESEYHCGWKSLVIAITKFSPREPITNCVPVLQPTGGPVLLEDTRPTEAKNLIEEKLKKVTTERAPVAGQQPSGSRNSRSALRSGPGGRSLLEGLVDPSQAGGNAMVEQLMRSQGRLDLSNLVEGQSQGVGGVGDGSGSGAAAAAGVLTALDEDGEGDEEAPPPREFEYFSDDDEDDEEEDEDDEDEDDEA